MNVIVILYIILFSSLTNITEPAFRIYHFHLQNVLDYAIYDVSSGTSFLRQNVLSSFSQDFRDNNFDVVVLTVFFNILKHRTNHKRFSECVFVIHKC